MITSHDVARRAGVSQATVSRAMRDQRGVSAETRSRVRAAALELGYVATHTSLARATRRTREVGVVSAALTNPFSPALIGPLQEALRERGLRTVLMTESEDELLGDGTLTDGSLDGIVLTTSSTASALPGELLARGIPFVLAGRTVDGIEADLCTVDNGRGAAMVADLLVELGHTCIGAIMGPETTSTGRERADGFVARLGELGVSPASCRMFRGPFSRDTGWKGLEALRVPVATAPPTAIFCGDDVIALGVLDAAASLQIRVPEELTVVGFDDIPSASWGPVGLTTVHVELADMATAVADALGERLEHPTGPLRRTVLAPRLVTRSTHARPATMSLTAPPAARDAPTAKILRPWISAVSGVARAVNGGHSRDAVLKVVSEESCRLIGFDYCAVMLADADEQQLSVAGFHGLTSSYVALVSDAEALQINPRDANSDSPAARAFRERRTIAVSDTASATVYGRLVDLAPLQGYRSLLATPLKEGNEVKGLLVGYHETPHYHSAAEIELTELLAEQTSVVLHTAGLRTAQQQVIDDLSQVNDQLRRAREQMEWAESQHHRLMQLILDGAGLDGLTHEISQILDATVTVEVDVHGNAPDSSTGSDPRSDWVIPIVVSGDRVGRLRVTGLLTHPAPTQQRAVERFALVVGVELLQRRHLLDVRERLSADLLTDLLREGGPTQPEAVVDRAAALGADLTRPHTLALVAPGDASLAHRPAGAVGGLVGSHEGRVVVLIPADQDAPAVTAGVWREARARRPDAIPVAVIGQRVDDVTGYARAYRAARGAATLRARTGPGIVDVRELGTFALLLADAPSKELVQFADGVLSQLASDHPILLDTLRVWMRSACSSARTAEQLGVHANTVTSRLKRTADLLELDLQSFETRMDLQLALTVREIASPTEIARA